MYGDDDNAGPAPGSTKSTRLRGDLGRGLHRHVARRGPAHASTLDRHELEYELAWSLSGHPFLTPRGALVDALAASILANSWFSHRANKKLLVETDGLTLSEGLAHEVYRGLGRGPDMNERIAGGFGSKAKA